MAIYIRNDIDFIIKDDIGLFIEGEMESIFVETTHKGHKMLVGEIYRVPNTDPVVAIERYDNILDKIQNVHNVIIGMDQNLDLLKVNTRGGRRSPAVACWASDHWVASLNPLRGKFRH